MTTNCTHIFAAAAALLLFASCLGHAPARGVSDDDLAVIADLNSYSSAARLQRLRYERYADRASADGNRTAAGLFSALARSERIHEQACVRAVSLLRGECRPMSSADVEVTDTRSNLRRSLDEERARFESGRGSAVERAIGARNYYTARILIWIDGTNRRHIELLERCMEAADGRTADGEGCEYQVCPVCGNIYHAASCDAYCPLCRTCRTEFESFGRLKVHQTVADGVDD